MFFFAVIIHELLKFVRIAIKIFVIYNYVNNFEISTVRKLGDVDISNYVCASIFLTTLLVSVIYFYATVNGKNVFFFTKFIF